MLIVCTTSFVITNLFVFFRMKLALDFTVLVVPLLLSFTILADFVPMVLTVLLCTSIGILIVFDQQKNLKKKPGTQLTWKSFLEKSIPSRRPFITNFRAYVNISTAIAILAVDFVVFPRRFAKNRNIWIWSDGYGCWIIYVFKCNCITRSKGKVNSSKVRCVSHHTQTHTKTFNVLITITA